MEDMDGGLGMCSLLLPVCQGGTDFLPGCSCGFYPIFFSWLCALTVVVMGGGLCTCCYLFAVN